MNKKLILGFLAGVVLTSLIFVTFYILTPFAKADADSSSTAPTDDKTVLQEFQTSLKIVSSEIKTPETKNYYDKLTASYDLDNVDNNANYTDTDITTTLPDLSKIQQNAISLPMTEAGKTITDKDIAKFYNNFLIDVGINETTQ